MNWTLLFACLKLCSILLEKKKKKSTLYSALVGVYGVNLVWLLDFLIPFLFSPTLSWPYCYLTFSNRTHVCCNKALQILSLSAPTPTLFSHHLHLAPLKKYSNKMILHSERKFTCVWMHSSVLTNEYICAINIHIKNCPLCFFLIPTPTGDKTLFWFSCWSSPFFEPPRHRLVQYWISVCDFLYLMISVGFPPVVGFIETWPLIVCSQIIIWIDQSCKTH